MLARIVINGCDDGKIRQVSAAAIRGVDKVGDTRPHGFGAMPDHALHTLAHGPQVHRHVRCIRHQFTLRIKDRAGEIQTFLDVYGVTGILQGRAHLLRNRHKQIVEDLQADRIYLRAHRGHSRERRSSCQHQVVALGQTCAPTRFNHNSAVRLDDDRRAFDEITHRKLVTRKDRRFERLLTVLAGVDGIYVCVREWFARSIVTALQPLLITGQVIGYVSGADHFHRSSLDD